MKRRLAAVLAGAGALLLGACAAPPVHQQEEVNSGGEKTEFVPPSAAAVLSATFEPDSLPCSAEQGFGARFGVPAADSPIHLTRVDRAWTSNSVVSDYQPVQSFAPYARFLLMDHPDPQRKVRWSMGVLYFSSEALADAELRLLNDRYAALLGQKPKPVFIRFGDITKTPLRIELQREGSTLRVICENDPLLPKPLAPLTAGEKAYLDTVKARLDAQLGGTYLQRVENTVLAATRYPAESLLHGENGIAIVAATLLRDGSTRDAHLVRSTGHPLLDAEALRLIQLRFPPVPEAAAPAQQEFELALPLTFDWQ